MRTKRTNPKDNTEINITPMLDIAFIMLIFFIVTPSFSKESGLNIFAANQSQPEENKVKIATIKLAVDSISVNGVATKLNGIESLLAHLKASNPDIKAQIYSAKNIKTGDLVQALQQIKANGIEKYSVSSF